MRWFIALLLVANVILYFWVQQQSKPLPGAATPPAPDIGHLRLIKEGDPQLAKTAIGKPGSGPAAEGEDGGEAGRDQLSGDQAEEPEVKPEVDPVPEQALAPPTPDDSVTPAPGASSAEAASVVQTPGGDSKAASRTDAPAAEVQPVCARVGPFAADEADKLLGGLPPYVRLLADVAEEYNAPDGYYVLIPALPSRVAGEQMMRELGSAGVKDIWLISSGDMRNAISLGFFKFDETAKRRAADIASKGFPVEIKENTAVQQRRWLHLKNVDGGDLRLSLPLAANVTVEPQACP